MDFTPGSGQRLLELIASEEGHLSKNSLRNVRGFLKGVFTFAQTQDCFTAINPMGPVKVPKGNPNHKKHVHAYSLEEVAQILDALEGVEPARTVIAVAVFAGLRKGEINGLKWGDLKDNVITIKPDSVDVKASGLYKDRG